MEKMMEMMFTKSTNPAFAKAARKIRGKNREKIECVMTKVSKALESITARYQEAPQERKCTEGRMGHLLM